MIKCNVRILLTGNQEMLNGRIILNKNNHAIDFDGIDMSDQEKTNLTKIFESLEKPNPGELNFLKLSVTEDSKKDLILKVLLRNSTDLDLDIKQISIRILNDEKKVISQGTFQLEDLIVLSGSSKPAKFVFPKKSVLIKNSDLLNSSIHVISNLRN